MTTSSWMPKRLSFTDDNLKRHVRSSNRSYQNLRKVIVTTRNKMKGHIGDVFDIGRGIFVLDKIVPYAPNERELLIETHHAEEGFVSKNLFRQELHRIYPEAQTLYVHIFKQLFVTVPLCFQCAKMKGEVHYPHDSGACVVTSVGCDKYGVQDLTCECEHFEPYTDALVKTGDDDDADV